MDNFVFIGERRSRRAQQMGVTWTDGHLAAATLHDALRAAGFDPAAQQYCNLWTDSGDFDYATLDHLVNELALGRQPVALGRKVSHELTRRGIPHVALVHPAARGKIRKTERYQAHVRATLLMGT